MSMVPHTQEILEDYEPITILADVAKEIGEVLEQGGGNVTRVAVIPNANIVGAASPASRNWILYNRTQARQIAILALVGGVNPAQGVESALAITNGAVAQGDVLEFQSTHVGGTGLVDPGGAVRVTITRTSAPQ